jgi:D-alanyl-D-alanine carboxypeptidase
MIAQPLQFDPGERSEYSNFGYCVLGRVIEKASGMSYGEYIQQELFKSIGIEDIKIARNLPRTRDPREVWYPGPDVLVEVMDSHGGLIASAPALCTFLDHYWINGEPRHSKQRGDWTFFGSLPGTTAMVRQRMDGYNIAVLCNSRRDQSFNEDDAQLQKVVDAAIDKVAKTSSK